jgi:type IV secretory pathway VirB10-like protein
MTIYLMRWYSEFGRGGSYETFNKKSFDRGFNTCVGCLFLIRLCNKKETTQPETEPAPAEVKAEDQTKSAPPTPPKGQQTTPPSSSPPPKPPEASQPPAQRSTEIVLAFVNLRQGPAMDSKIISVLKKGTKLTVLEEKAGWLRVRLEDGTEGWVGKAMTSEGSQPKSP